MDDGICDEVFLEPVEFGLLFQPFCLGPHFEEFQKMAEFGVFGEIGHSSELRALLQPRFEAECFPMMAL